MTHLKGLLGGLFATAICTLHPAWADPAITPTLSQDALPRMDLADYETLSSLQSRNYDRDQDISPRQMLRLLEVCERTGASLGNLLATGEMESAHTWNDFVRPTLPSGKLGAATGVWQFMPGTFHRIIKTYGSQILSDTAADPATGRAALDLGDGPFDDAQVRDIIRTTVDASRSADDGELQLLRHNFTLLAFATIYLSRDSGATTPVEAYLFHFLGEGMGRRVLALARGPARDTLSVKPAETELAQSTDQSQRQPRPSAGSGGSTSLTRPVPTIRPIPTIQPVPTVLPPQGLSDLSFDPKRDLANLDAGRQPERMRLLLGRPAETSLEPATFYSAPSPSSERGLPADSPTVTGNLGMFYRDGKGQSQPYTWAEFMQNLERHVRAHDQPALVRAKYGVGFSLAGGDMDSWTFDPGKPPTPTKFRIEGGADVLLPSMLLLETLTAVETRSYKTALEALVGRGEDRPLDRLPADALRSLRRLTALPDTVEEGCSTKDPAVQKALKAFRRMTGKEAPDDPDHADRLMPAERVALQIYDQRLSRYAALQSSQQLASRDALDLTQMMRMPHSRQRFSTFEITALQTALAERGLLKRPTKKVVWRDKRRKKHFRYKTLPFSGKADKATLAALNTFQWRQGLVQTKGVMDTLTLGLLGLPAMGPEIFEPLKGPTCALERPPQNLPAFSPVEDERPTLGFRLLGYNHRGAPCDRFETGLLEPLHSDRPSVCRHCCGT